MNDFNEVGGDGRQDGPQAADELLPLVYEELRKLAAHKLAQEAPGQTLQHADDLWPRGTWAWPLTRGMACWLVGHRQYTVVDINRLVTSEAMGPLGAFVSARLVAFLEPTWTVPFIQRITSLPQQNSRRICASCCATTPWPARFSATRC